MSQQENANPNVGQMRIYACGGTGMNIARYFEPARGEYHPGMAQVHPAYFDTSRSNVTAEISQENAYLLTKSADGVDIDGGGKVRRLNAQEIVDAVKPFLNRFEPMDLNVVIFSSAGGSGSVFGPSLIGELLQRGERVVGLVVGSVASGKEVENAVNSFKTLDNISRNTVGAPLVIAYEQNGPDSPRGHVDQIMQTLASQLSILTSRQNDELDRQDILHALRPDKAFDYEARVLTMEIFVDNKTLETEAAAGAQFVSVASLYQNRESTPTSATPAYAAVGYMPQALFAGVRDDTKRGQIPKTLHYAVRQDDFNKIFQDLKSKDSELRRLTTASPAAKSVLESRDTAGPGGLIL